MDHHAPFLNPEFRTYYWDLVTSYFVEHLKRGGD